MTLSTRPKRDAAMRRACPRCNAKPGYPCFKAEGEMRIACHQERHSRENKRRARTLRDPGDFYSSEAWRHARYQALKQAGGACQCCGTRASRAAPLHVDHIRPRSKFPELSLDPSNLQVLCEDCNLGKSNRDQTDWRPQAGRLQ